MLKTDAITLRDYCCLVWCRTCDPVVSASFRKGTAAFRPNVEFLELI